MIVTELGEFVKAVYDVWQLPDDKVQEGSLNVPPKPPSLHATVLVGIVGEPEVSFTLTVNASEPEDNVAGFGVTVVVVEWITVSDDVAKLAECALSPA